jgi:hypothetical protein
MINARHCCLALLCVVIAAAAAAATGANLAGFHTALDEAFQRVEAEGALNAQAKLAVKKRVSEQLVAAAEAVAGQANSLTACGAEVGVTGLCFNMLDTQARLVKTRFEALAASRWLNKTAAMAPLREHDAHLARLNAAMGAVDRALLKPDLPPEAKQLLESLKTIAATLIQAGKRAPLAGRELSDCAGIIERLAALVEGFDETVLKEMALSRDFATRRLVANWRMANEGRSPTDAEVAALRADANRQASLNKVAATEVAAAVFKRQMRRTLRGVGAYASGNVSVQDFASAQGQVERAAKVFGIPLNARARDGLTRLFFEDRDKLTDWFRDRVFGLYPGLRAQLVAKRVDVASIGLGSLSKAFNTYTPGAAVAVPTKQQTVVVVHVRDKGTGRPIANATVAIRLDAGRGKLFQQTGATAKFVNLSATNVLVTIGAPGYKTVRSTGNLTPKPGETREVTVSLQKEQGGTTTVKPPVKQPVNVPALRLAAGMPDVGKPNLNAADLKARQQAVHGWMVAALAKLRHGMTADPLREKNKNDCLALRGKPRNITCAKCGLKGMHFWMGQNWACPKCQTTVMAQDVKRSDGLTYRQFAAQRMQLYQKAMDNVRTYANTLIKSLK